MAKDKKKNKKVTAGDLFGKLGKRTRDESATNGLGITEDETILDDELLGGEIDRLSDTDSSIDVSGGSAESDSELDINELLRKYMPEYENEEEKSDGKKSGGILSMLKNDGGDTVSNESLTENVSDEDEQLISSLDSAFGIPKKVEKTEKKVEKTEKIEKVEETAEEIEEKRPAALDGFIDEYELEPDDGEFEDELENEVTDEDTEDEDEPEIEEKPKKKKKSVFSLFGGKKKKQSIEVAESTSEDELLIDDEAEVAADESDAATEDVVEEVAAEVSATGAATEETVAENEEASHEEVVPETQAVDSVDEVAEAATPVEENAESDDEGEEFNLDDEEFDPTDINLMVAFGLDGKDNKQAKEFGDRLEAKQHSHDSRKIKIDHPEYVDKSQIPTIRKEFTTRKLSLRIRFVLCAVFTVLLMIFENITTITKLFTGTEQQFAGFLDPAVYPVVYIMVSLQLMLLACYCAVGEIATGFKNIFRGTPTPESMTALLTFGGILYSAVLAVTVKAPNEPVMFNFVTAVSALLTLIYAMYNNKRESMNFAVVANRKPKHIVRRLPDEESEGEARAFAEQDDACDVMKIEKTDFIDGFFGRLRKPDTSTGVFMTFAMSASVALAVLLGIFVNFRGGESDTAAICRVVYSSLLMLAPLSAYITFSYPMYRANVAAKQYDSAIIGDAAIEEYSNASIISFDDKNVFPSYSVKVQNMRIYNNARIDRVLYYAASVFAYAGGPLQDVFEVATRDMGVSGNVKIFDTESGFLAAQVDGVNIIFGSGQNLRNRGLDIPEAALVDDVDLSDELSIMYMFRESKLVAKFYVKYVMDSDIDLILKQFSGSGLYVCVRTFDPNIDEAMIAKKAGMKKMPLKILRYSSADEVGRYEEKVDSGLVTSGSPKSLLQVITYCGKVLHTKKTDIALGVLSVLIGAAILALLLLADSLTVLSSLLIVLYQLIWLIPISIASKVFIR